MLSGLRVKARSDWERNEDHCSALRLLDQNAITKFEEFWGSELAAMVRSHANFSLNRAALQVSQGPLLRRPKPGRSDRSQFGSFRR